MHRALAGLAVLCLASTASAQKPSAAQFGWQTDYNAARAEARKTGKPMMLVFRCEP